ncbi:alpha/beta-hydrolase [Rhizodiscina lignyota]|uniref:Alpha/beta-hydrolase n=1 Tax=Rhizodiscina lignyota TaxID=1504668 RepID=A0A9P4MB87_9PEZI|nr:alpha/beta-hydrolase [Rhizodiscina lignyota]
MLVVGHNILRLFHSKLVPQTSGLDWSPCGAVAGHDVQCARLDVPMDHFAEEGSTTAEKTFSLALTRLVGKNATKSLLINPGGPGGSGGEFVFRRGEQLNKIVGEGYHLLSFDPRGVNQSTPKAACFLNDIDRTVDKALKPLDPWTQSGDFYAYYENLAQACRDIMGEAGAYFNTPQTAADMNSILDAVGQERMLYWGFSYGTTLGQTYAQMFPERVERLIIDGVSNQIPWYNPKLSSADEFDSTDAVYKGFIQECFKSGDACPLAAGYVSAEDLRTNLTRTILDLYDDPIPVYINASLHGEIRFFDVAWDGIFPSLYKPTTWPQLAENLAALMQGNLSVPFQAWSLPENEWSDLYEANMVIVNSDLAPRDQLTRPKMTRREILVAMNAFHNASTIAGDTEADSLFELESWRYARSHSFVPAERVKTAHPLLILSTSLDPICPLISAQKANAVYEGSVLLEQRSMGHCTVSMPSNCTAKHVRKYLDSGKLPKVGTTCEIDDPYFNKPKDESRITKGLSRDEEELAAALKALANDPPWSKSALYRRAR